MPVHGKNVEPAYESYPGNDSDVFHQFRPESPGDAAGGRHQRGYGIDIRNPWISWASGPLWDWDLQNFVDILQNYIFFARALEING